MSFIILPYGLMILIFIDYQRKTFLVFTPSITGNLLYELLVRFD